MEEQKEQEKVPLKFARFKDADWFNKEGNAPTCLVGGAGGIGSWLCLLLSRAGFPIMVYDMDSIEEHNLGGQFYTKSQNRQLKVVALQANIKDYADTDINISMSKMDENTPTNPIVFSAFDNMEARKNLFNKWKKVYCTEGSINYDSNAIFIDGRLNAETFQIFSIKNNAEDIANYEANLFDDNDVEDAPCTIKQTSHFATMITSLMTSFFTNHYSNVVNNNKLRKVPLYYEYVGHIAFTNKNLINE